MQIKTDVVVKDCIENPRAHRAIFEKEGELTIKNLVDMEDRMQAYRLRNNIFCKELGWALQTENGLEIDEHDEEATFLGVLNKDGRLLAYLRIILADRRFMIEKEFLSLVSSGYIVRKKYDTIEVSRLCVAPE
jgi:N-acyl-L-homoserine lactone synthetase